MNINLFLCCQSFDYRSNYKNEVFAVRLDNLNTVIESVQKYDIKFKMSPLWFSQEIKDGESLGNWIYDTRKQEEHTERTLMMLLVDQSESIDHITYQATNNNIINQNPDPNTALIRFYEDKVCNPPYDLYIHNYYDWLKVHRFYLHNCTHRQEFYDGLSISYPKLYFGENVLHSMNYFSPFRDFVSEIIAHLNTLNDDAPRLFQQYGEEEALKQLNTKVYCSGQGDSKYSKECLNLPFLNSKGQIEHVVCSPHTKLFHAGSDYRIYFSWNKISISVSHEILVGHIGRHL